MTYFYSMVGIDDSCVQSLIQENSSFQNFLNKISGRSSYDKLNFRFKAGKTNRPLKYRITENYRDYAIGPDSEVFYFTSSGDSIYEEQVVLNTTWCVANKLRNKKYVRLNWRTKDFNSFDPKKKSCYPVHTFPSEKPTTEINQFLLEKITTSLKIQFKKAFISRTKTDQFMSLTKLYKDQLEKFYSNILRETEYEKIYTKYQPLHKNTIHKYTK